MSHFALGRAVPVLAGTLALLTGCLPPPIPTRPLWVSVAFEPLPAVQRPLLMAYAVDVDGRVAEVSTGYVNAAQGSGSLHLGPLMRVANDPRVTTSFVNGEAHGASDVSVTPSTVRTANVYLVLGDDLNRNGRLEDDEVIYGTNDFFSYATESFRYAMTYPAGSLAGMPGLTVRESGERAQGWSLVRHEVRESRGEPGTFAVTRSSTDDLRVWLKPETNPLVSLSRGER